MPAAFRYSGDIGYTWRGQRVVLRRELRRSRVGRPESRASASSSASRAPLPPPSPRECSAPPRSSPSASRAPDPPPSPPRSIEASITPCGLMPAEDPSSARLMPRTATSEAVTRSAQMAICATSNTSRRENRRRAGSASPFLIICSGLPVHACRAGTIPISSALATVSARPARYTRGSRSRSRRWWPEPRDCRPPVQRGQQHARAHQPRGAPDERDHQRLRQQLPGQPQPARAEGHAKRQLPAAIRRARRECAGQVHADRRQQQERQHVHAVEKSANALTVVSHQTRADQSHRDGLVRLRDTPSPAGP